MDNLRAGGATEDPLPGFRERYGDAAQVVGYAPGRVNVIGEHVDYNLGRVLPFAIGQRITVAADDRADGVIEARSNRVGSAARFPVDVTAPAPQRTWENYLRGIVHGLRSRGVAVPGARLWLGGDLPPGVGLSSSAALCVATTRALLALADVDLPGTEIVRISQQAEHDFAGTPCGVMDQYASTFGRGGYALLVNTHELTHDEVPITLPDTEWLVIPSGVAHALVDGAYEQRVRDCQAALQACRAVAPDLAALGDVDEALLAQARPRMSETVARRARHVVTEMARVTRMVAALGANDVAAVGQLLWETQDSLRDDYAVSCDPVDALVALLRRTPGVHGARMVGGGFGGALLALVAAGRTGEVSERVQRENYAPRGVTCAITRVTPSDGARAARID